jgi:hypothetical protein
MIGDTACAAPALERPLFQAPGGRGLQKPSISYVPDTALRVPEDSSVG